MKVKALILVVVAALLAIAMAASWTDHAQKSGASWTDHAQKSAASWTDRAKTASWTD
jgi:hypothetical protein